MTSPSQPRWPNPGPDGRLKEKHLPAHLGQTNLNATYGRKDELSDLVGDALDADTRLARADDVTTTDFEGAVGDANGIPSWLQFDSRGNPTAKAIAAIREKLGIYFGPTTPAPPTGSGEYIWFQTDGNGNHIDTLIGKA